MTLPRRIPRPAGWFRMPEFRRGELFVMRLLFAVVVWDILPGAVTLRSQPDPVGLARWIDFSFLSQPGVFLVFRAVAAAALVVYVAGFWLWVVLPLVVAIVVSAGTLEASQGATNHGTTIVALVLVAQCAGQIWARVRGRHEGHDSGALVAWMSQQTIAATYVVSATSKIVGDGNWVLDAARNYPLQMVKTDRQNYYNSLHVGPDDPRGGVLATLARWVEPVATPLTELLFHSPFWRGALLGSSFLLELFAFVALIGRKCSAAVGLGLIFMHFAIYLVMELKFQYNMALAIIFLVNGPYWLTRAARGLARR